MLHRDTKHNILKLILSAEVLMALVSNSKPLGAGVVFSLVSVALAMMMFEEGRFRWPDFLRRKGPVMIIFAMFTGLGVYASVLGLYFGNSSFYLTTDAYHWFVELTAVAAVTYWALRDATSEEIGRIVATAALLTGLAGVASYFLGMTGVLDTGGHIVGSTGYWRIKLSKNFSLFMVIASVSALSTLRPLSLRTRERLSLALVFQAFTMFFAFKRSMWLTLPVLLALSLLSRRNILRALVVLAVVVPLFVGGAFMTGKVPKKIGRKINRVLSYNPNISLEKSLGKRFQQFESLKDAARGNVTGYGFGAQFRAYHTKTKKLARVHYIHNLYISYFMQFGPVGSLLIFTLGGYLFVVSWRGLNARPTVAWASRTALAGIVAIAVPGMVLVSMHTVAAGFVTGLALLVLDAGQGGQGGPDS